MSVDYTYRVRIPHVAGQLAKVTGEIADAGGLIGDIVTSTVGRTESIREITISVRDEGHAEDLAARLEELEGVSVGWFRDRALMRHEGGKLEIVPVREIGSVQDMRDVYTPGVARAVGEIADDPARARDYTMIPRTVAVCTNGTRVLGLGDVGPVAAMPVMEGKAAFYCQLVGLSAMPLLVETDDPDEFVETVVRVAPTFGGIHLEDIDSPACFEIERRLIEALPKPVMHDDVHGTAVVTLAAAVAAARQADLDLRECTVGQVGLGAAGLGIGGLMVAGGAERVLGSDPDERSHDLARERGIEITDFSSVMRECEVVVATTGQPGLIQRDAVRDGQVILALSNPEPEIDPEAAMEAGAAFAADGSVVNNVLGYPGIFKGALEANADCIDTEMKLAAAWAIAGLSVESELVPDPLDREVHEKVAAAVAEAARTGQPA